MHNHSLLIQTVVTSSSINPNFQPKHALSLPQSSNLHIKFGITHRKNHQYLKSLNIIPPSNEKFLAPETVVQLLDILTYFKSKGFSESHIQRLAIVNPKIFALNTDTTRFEPIFEFLINDLVASKDESLEFILKCPNLLFSSVEYKLRPTLMFLKELGLEKLNVPSSLNAHLLDIGVKKLVAKIRFLESLGMSIEEARSVCVRFPAVFGYSVENNLEPKFDYLVNEMEMGVEEIKEFPQLFAFSLEKRIVPRHLHLKKRGLKVLLKRMLLWSDQKFYAKWK